MDSTDSTDTTQFEPVDPASTPAPAVGRSGRTKRLVTSVAASALLLGGGAGIGIALTGGASASTGGGSAATGSASTTSTSASTATTGLAATTAVTSAAGRCARLEQRLRRNGHGAAASLVQTYCRSPLLRLALVGGEHGEVTFKTKAGPKTVAFERGTIQAVSSSAITVVAGDGTTWMWAIAPTTKVRDSGQTVTTANLSTGELVLVGGPVVSGAYDAQVIRVRKAS